VSKAAFVFAILVAIFPTKDFDEGFKYIPKWVMDLSMLIKLQPDQIHNFAAVLLFVCLILLMLFFSIRAKNKGALKRSRIYLGISLAMLIGMPSVYLVGKYTGIYAPIFCVELVGLWLFAGGWFLAGSYTPIPPEPVPGDAIGLDVVKVDPRDPDFETKITIEAGVTYIFGVFVISG